MNRFLTVLAASAVALMASGCATSPSPFANAPIYNGQAAYQASSARVVTVESVQLVQLKRGTNGTWQAFAAPAIGGVIGGVAGSAVGKGKGNQLASVVGAAMGAGLGQAVQDAGNLVPGFVYTFSFYSAEGKVTKTVPQEADDTLAHIAPGWQPGTPFPANVKARFTQGAGGDRILPL